MNMKFLSMLAITVLIITLVSISGCTQSSGDQGGSQPGANAIEIKSYAFSPSELTIKKGETVTWTNKDPTSHTITSDSGDELDSGPLSSGGTYSHTFNNVGTFDYHCSIHSTMKGKVIVE